MASTPRLVLGTDGVFSRDYPFLNFFKTAISLQAGSNYAYPAILNAEGYPQSSPAQNIFGTVRLPESYVGNWVIKWTGTGSMRLDRGSPGFTVVDGEEFVVGATTSNLEVTGTDARVEFSFTTSPVDAVTFNFMAGDTFSGMAGAVLCRSGDEAALDGGAIFTDDYLDRVAALNPKVVRMLGWANVNEGCNIGRDGYQCPVGAFSYRSTRWEPGAWAGTISGTDTYTCAAAPDTPVSWTDGEVIQGQFTNANTITTPTLNVNSRGAKTIVRVYTDALVVGDIGAGSLGTLRYDATLDKLIYKNAGFTASAPIEVQVALANATGCDLWITLPHFCDDDWVATEVAYAQANLDSGLKCYVEFSNEIWNSGGAFPQTAWARAYGVVFGFPDADNRRVYGPYGKRVREVMEVATDAWAPRVAAELRRVMAFQAAGASNGTNLYRFQGADLGAWGFNVEPNRPIDWCDVLSYATYYCGAQIRNFDANWNVQMPEALAAADAYDSGVPAAMEGALGFVDYDIRQGTRNGTLGDETITALRAKYSTWETHADTYDLEVSCYEGACEIAAPSEARLTALGIDTAYAAKFEALIEGYKNDARFQQLVVDQANEFCAKPHSQYASWLALTGPNQWALLVGDIDSAEYKSFDALVAFDHAEMRCIV